MENMDGWDIALLVIAAYVAVTVLVRLMIRRRDELMARLRQEMAINKKTTQKTADEAPRAPRRRQAG